MSKKNKHHRHVAGDVFETTSTYRYSDGVESDGKVDYVVAGSAQAAIEKVRAAKLGKRVSDGTTIRRMTVDEVKRVARTSQLLV